VEPMKAAVSFFNSLMPGRLFNIEIVTNNLINKKKGITIIASKKYI